MSPTPEDPLFEVEPEAPLTKGQVVRIQTMFGLEDGIVVEVGHDHGFPVVTLKVTSGDTVTVSVGRVVRR